VCLFNLLVHPHRGFSSPLYGLFPRRTRRELWCVRPQSTMNDGCSGHPPSRTLSTSPQRPSSPWLMSGKVVLPFSYSVCRPMFQCPGSRPDFFSNCRSFVTSPLIHSTFSSFSPRGWRIPSSPTSLPRYALVWTSTTLVSLSLISPPKAVCWRPPSFFFSLPLLYGRRTVRYLFDVGSFASFYHDKSLGLFPGFRFLSAS